MKTIYDIILAITSLFSRVVGFLENLSYIYRDENGVEDETDLCHIFFHFFTEAKKMDT
jgi:hypothetical protein